MRIKVRGHEFTGRQLGAAGALVGSVLLPTACSGGGGTTTVYETTTASAPASTGGGHETTATPLASARDRATGANATESPSATPAARSGSTEAPAAPTSSETPYQQAVAARSFVMDQCARLVMAKTAVHFYDPKFNNPSDIYYGFNVKNPKGGNGALDEAKCVTDQTQTDFYVNNSSTQSAEWMEQGPDDILVTIQDGPDSAITSYSITPSSKEYIAGTKEFTPAEAAEMQAFSIATADVVENGPSVPTNMPDSYKLPAFPDNPFLAQAA